MGVKIIRIYQLDGIVNARLELKGGFFEIEVPAGPVAGGYINKRLGYEQLAELLGGTGAPGTGPSKSLSFYKIDEATGQALVAVGAGSSKKLANYRLIVFRAPASGNRSGYPYAFPSPF